MTLSIAEVEHFTSFSASCEEVWLRKLLFDLFDLQLDATCIYCDNQSCVNLSENPVFDASRSISISSISTLMIWCREEQ